jgi:threonylcarbamoyladenosine tRNA methylthiotransferase MtaB
MESMIGKKQRVLVEKADRRGRAQGYGEHYLPVQFVDTDAARNKFREVVLEAVFPSDPPLLSGKITAL